MTEPLNPPIAASTLILFREQPDEKPEILMVRRSGKMAFAADALVFPGGRVDADDHHLAGRYGAGLELEDAASRVAAIRETVEEVGVAVGFVDEPEVAIVAELRKALHSGAILSDLLTQYDLGLDLDALAPFARWCPAENLTRRFDTRFYLAMPTNPAVAEVDQTENVSALWASVETIFSLCDAGHHHVIFPTFCNLRRLQEYDSFEQALAHSLAYPACLIEPRVESRDGVDYIVIPNNHGYPVIAMRRDALKRG